MSEHRPTYKTTASYHLALAGDVSIHSDVTQQFETPDALAAAEQAIKAIRDSTPKRGIVVNLVLVVSLRI